MIHPVLALDYGEARIGLAATDDLGIAAHAIGTIHLRNTDPLEHLRALVAERGVQQFVLGLPLRTDGNEGRSARNVRSFGDTLRKTFPEIPLHYCDERFSTLSAAEKLRQAGKNAKQQKGLIDQTAALEILHSWLGW